MMSLILIVGMHWLRVHVVWRRLLLMVARSCILQWLLRRLSGSLEVWRRCWLCRPTIAHARRSWLHHQTESAPLRHVRAIVLEGTSSLAVPVLHAAIVRQAVSHIPGCETCLRGERACSATSVPVGSRRRLDDSHAPSFEVLQEASSANTPNLGHPRCSLGSPGSAPTVAPRALVRRQEGCMTTWGAGWPVERWDMIDPKRPTRGTPFGAVLVFVLAHIGRYAAVARAPGKLPVLCGVALNPSAASVTGNDWKYLCLDPRPYLE